MSMDYAGDKQNPPNSFFKGERNAAEADKRVSVGNVDEMPTNVYVSLNQPSTARRP